jgi:hypothetical protein
MVQPGKDLSGKEIIWIAAPKTKENLGLLPRVLKAREYPKYKTAIRYLNNPADRFDSLSKGTIQFALARSSEIESLGQAASPKIVAAGALVRCLHIVTTKSSQIKRLDHFKGKKVSIGPPKSDTETAAIHLLDAMSIKRDQLKCENNRFDEQPEKLRRKSIDAFLELGEVPSQNICLVGEDLELIPIERDIVLEMERKSKNPYKPGFIRVKCYLPNQEERYIQTALVIDYIVSIPSMKSEYVKAVTGSIINFYSLGMSGQEAVELVLSPVDTYLPYVKMHGEVYNEYKAFYRTLEEKKQIEPIRRQEQDKIRNPQTPIPISPIPETPRTPRESPVDRYKD